MTIDTRQRLQFIATLCRRAGPYVLVELLLPGGTLLAIALFIYRRSRRDGLTFTAALRHEVTPHRGRDRPPARCRPRRVAAGGAPQPRRTRAARDGAGLLTRVLVRSGAASVPDRFLAHPPPTKEATMNQTLAAATLAAALALGNGPAWAAEPVQDPIERGRYLVRIGGCNDCHTAGYLEAAGHSPEADWLTGSAVGFQGPWARPIRRTCGSRSPTIPRRSGSRARAPRCGRRCRGSTSPR